MSNLLTTDADLPRGNTLIPGYIYRPFVHVGIIFPFHHSLFTDFDVQDAQKRVAHCLMCVKDLVDSPIPNDATTFVIQRRLLYLNVQLAKLELAKLELSKLELAKLIKDIDFEIESAKLELAEKDLELAEKDLELDKLDLAKSKSKSLSNQNVQKLERTDEKRTTNTTWYR